MPSDARHHVVPRRRWWSPSTRSLAPAPLTEGAAPSARSHLVVVLVGRIGEEVRRHQAPDAIKFTHVETIFIHITINEYDFTRLKTQFHLLQLDQARGGEVNMSSGMMCSPMEPEQHLHMDTVFCFLGLPYAILSISSDNMMILHYLNLNL